MDYLHYSQGYMLAVSVMAGTFFGFMWDIYRLFRHYIKLGKTGTAIGDVSYWIISVYIGIKLILDLSYGNVRLFILMGFILGALLYFYGISRYILKAFIFVTDKILKVIWKVINFLAVPIKFIIKQINLVLNPVRLKCEKERNKLKRRYKFFKFRLKKVSKDKKRVYNKKKKSKRSKRKIRKIQKEKRRGQKQVDRRKKDYRTKKKNKQ